MAYTREQQRATAASVRPVLWARLAVNHTKLTFCLSGLVPLVLLGIVVATGFSLDNPSAADYLIRDDLRTRLDDARIAALDQFPYPPDGGAALAERSREVNEDSVSILLRGRVGTGGPIGVVDETSDKATNVLTKQGLALLKKAEDGLFDDPQYKKVCLRDANQVDCQGAIAQCVLPTSVLSSRFLYGQVNADGAVCARKPGAAEVSDADFASFLDELVVDGEVNPVYAGSMGNDFSPTNRTTWILQSLFRIGEPFAGFNSSDDRETEQDELYEDFAKDAIDRIEDFTTPDIDAYLFGISLGDISFDSIVIRDLSFSIGAIILVFLVICFHTSSPFLAFTAMFQIFLAFPFSYIVYRYVLQQKYFAALQILVIFLILGIGADDVFVFIDAWKQAGVVLGSDCDLVTRMSWTYRRAVKAMSVTSVTTASAFFVTATSPIMPIGTLGVWAGILILLQFVLVITIFPCATIIWHRFYRVRTVTNCFKKPAEGMENTPTPSIFARCLPAKLFKEKEEDGAEEYRTVERFFRGPWTNFIRKFRYALVVLGATLVGLALWRATLLSAPDEAEEFLPSDHPFRVAQNALQDAFPTSEEDFQLRVKVTWGISGVDRTGTSRFDTENAGKAVLDDSFNMRSVAAQQHILDACQFFEDQKTLIFQEKTIDPIQCWIRDFKAWRANNSKPEFQNYASDKDFITELIQFGTATENDGRQPYLRYLYGQHFAFNAARDKIVLSEIRFVSPVEASVPYKVMWPVYNDWQDELEKLNTKAPAGMDAAFATGGYSWMWQITQRTLVSAMFTGIGIMLAVAVVALTVSALNWYVAILATLSIGSIVAVLLGVIELLGWQLGITESIGVVIAVGYSFDGAAHIATAYVESRDADRFSRTRDALTDLGISILFGAISTLLAGFMLFPAIIIFFVKFAGLIVATVALGAIWSLLFFPAILMSIGPTNKFGDLRPILAKVTGSCTRNKNVDSDLDAVEKIAKEDPEV